MMTEDDSPYDNPPVDWSGEIAVVIGAGPSLTRKQCRAAQGRAKIIAVNRAVEWAPWADVWYFCDYRFSQWHAKAIADWPRELWTLENRRLRNDRWPHLRCLKNFGDGGPMQCGPGVVNYRNGGAQAIQLAHKRGARLIVLLGFDMKPGAGGRRQFHDPHPIADAPIVYETVMLPRMAELAESLASRGATVINATPLSALQCFPKCDIESVFGDNESGLTNHANSNIVDARPPDRAPGPVC